MNVVMLEHVTYHTHYNEMPMAVTRIPGEWFVRSHWLLYWQQIMTQPPSPGMDDITLVGGAVS